MTLLSDRPRVAEGTVRAPAAVDADSTAQRPPAVGDSPRGLRAQDLLDVLRQMLSTESTLLTYVEPSSGEHRAIASHGYSAAVVDFLCGDFVRLDPDYARLSHDQSRLYFWDNTDGFRDGISARKVFIPSGYQEGCSLPLFDATGALLGLCHVSLRHDLFPEHAVNTLGSLRPMLAAVAESARRQSRAALTARELDVLALIVEGLPNSGISQVLSIAPSTVRRHVEHIFMKLEVDNRVSAAVKALELDMVPHPR